MRPASSYGRKIGKDCSGLASAILTNLIKLRRNEKNEISLFNSEHTIHTFWDTTTVIPRIESFALASYGNNTKGVIVCGIDPVAENRFSHLSDKLQRGTLLRNTDNGVLVSSRLARFLNLDVADTLVLIGQGYQGNSAAGLFPVRGIIKLPSPEIDNQMIYMPLSLAQNFYSAEGRLTTLVIEIKSEKEMADVTDALSQKLEPSGFEVMSWHDMLKELYQQYISDEGSAFIILGLLYLVVGFGIFGTVLMMTSERKREFSIMIAVGMRRIRIVSLLALELFFISLIGVIAGMAGSVPIIGYYHFNPIKFTGETAQVMEQYGMDPVMPTLWQPGYILGQGLAVFVITLIIIVYPLYSVSKLNVAKCIK